MPYGLTTMKEVLPFSSGDRGQPYEIIRSGLPNN